MIIQRHPVDGYLDLVFEEDAVALYCHWPVDQKTREWIDIANLFDRAGYTQAVRDAVATGIGKARGITGGYLLITAIGDGCAVEFSRPQDGWAATSLRIFVRRPLADLLQRHEHAREAATSA